MRADSTRMNFPRPRHVQYPDMMDPWLPEEEAVEMVRKIGGTCVGNQRSTTFDIKKKVGFAWIILHLTVTSNAVCFMGDVQPGLEDLCQPFWDNLQREMFISQVPWWELDIGLARPVTITVSTHWKPTFSVWATTRAHLAVIVQRIFKVDI
jgi:hypothetical protein